MALINDIDRAIDLASQITLKSEKNCIRVETNARLKDIKNDWAKPQYMALFRKVYKRVDERREKDLEAHLACDGVYVRKILR
jgi:hypothetical protein